MLNNANKKLKIKNFLDRLDDVLEDNRSNIGYLYWKYGNGNMRYTKSSDFRNFVDKEAEGIKESGNSIFFMLYDYIQQGQYRSWLKLELTYLYSTKDGFVFYSAKISGDIYKIENYEMKLFTFENYDVIHFTNRNLNISNVSFDSMIKNIFDGYKGSWGRMGQDKGQMLRFNDFRNMMMVKALEHVSNFRTNTGYFEIKFPIYQYTGNNSSDVEENAKYVLDVYYNGFFMINKKINIILEIRLAKNQKYKEKIDKSFYIIDRICIIFDLLYVSDLLTGTKSLEYTISNNVVTISNLPSNIKIISYAYKIVIV